MYKWPFSCIYHFSFFSTGASKLCLAGRGGSNPECSLFLYGQRARHCCYISKGALTHTRILKNLKYLLFSLLQKKFPDLFLAYLNTTGEEPGERMSERWKTQYRERRYQWRKVPKQAGGDEQSIEGRISLKQEEGPLCHCRRMEEGTIGIDEGRKQGWVWMWMYL